MFTFNGIESGSLSYNISVIPVQSNVAFSFGLGNSGVFGGETGRALIYFSGNSGKFYDQDQNYVFETMNADQKANMYDFISNFEEAKKKKKVVKKQSTSLELFMGV